MEFMNRGAVQPSAPARVTNNGGATVPVGGGKKKSWKQSPLWLRVGWLVLLLVAAVFLVCFTILFYIGGPNEAKNVNKKLEQAVFLTNGQVYFGNIKTITHDYLDLQNIYYLNVNQQVQPDQSSNKQTQNSVSLVKLGCELHGPVDEMIINRSQVTFWENLKSDGQVSKAIATWVKDNPNGQQCQTPSSSSSSNTSATTPDSTPASTTPATSTTKP